MSTIRVNKSKENPYVMLNKTALYDNKLSFKAKGIFAYLMSRPDDWVCQVGDLIKHAKDGRDSVYAGLRELRENGYMIKRPIKDKLNRITEWEEILFEVPQEHAKEVYKEQKEAIGRREKKEKKPVTENPNMDITDEKSTYGISISGISTSGEHVNIINNDTTNNELLNNKSSSNMEISLKDITICFEEGFSKKLSKYMANKIKDYINQTDINFVYIVLNYSLEHGANSPSYFFKTLNSLIEKEIRSVSKFTESIKQYYDKVEKKKANSFKSNKKISNKTANFTQRKQDEDYFQDLEKALVFGDFGSTDEDTEN